MAMPNRLAHGKCGSFAKLKSVCAWIPDRHAWHYDIRDRLRVLLPSDSETIM